MLQRLYIHVILPSRNLTCILQENAKTIIMTTPITVFKLFPGCEKGLTEQGILDWDRSLLLYK